MKANELIKEHGLNKAKVLLSTQGKTIANLKSEYTEEQLKEYQGYIVSGDLMSFVELKRLVESYQLIQSYKGCGKPREYALSTAKFTLNHFKSTRELEIEIYGNNDREVRLEQAILDVESCR